MIRSNMELSVQAYASCVVAKTGFQVDLSWAKKELIECSELLVQLPSRSEFSPISGILRSPRLTAATPLERSPVSEIDPIGMALRSQRREL